MGTGYGIGARFAVVQPGEAVADRLASALMMALGVAALALCLAAPSGSAQAADSARARSKTRAPVAALPRKAGASGAARRSSAAAGGDRAVAAKTAASKVAGATAASAKAVGARTAGAAASGKSSRTRAPSSRAAWPRSVKTSTPARSRTSARQPVGVADKTFAAAAKSLVPRAARGGVAAHASNDRREAKRSASGVKTVSLAPAAPMRQTVGHATGLHDVYDPLALHSAVALVQDAVTGEVLFEKNPRAVLPIASISKLMTAMVVLDAGLPMDEVLEISEADIDTERFSRSRLRPGTQLSRGEMLHLALMSSENRAANALGRHYPGGLPAFVARMNVKAEELGMPNTRFVEPTGLSSSNVSNALDLAKMVKAASAYPLIRAYSTASSLVVDAGARPLSFRNTNRLVDHSDWEIRLQKTGYISDAGNCMVLQTGLDGRPIVMVLLDADGAAARTGDAQRLRQWLEGTPRMRGGELRAFAQPSRGS